MIWLGKGAMCLTGTAHQSILSIKLQAEGRTQVDPNISCHFLCPTLTPVSGAQHYSSAEGQTPSWCHAFAIRVSLFEARHPWCLMVTCSCIALFDALNVLWNMSTTKQPDMKRPTSHRLCAALGWRHFRDFMHMFSARGTVSLVSNKVLHKEKVEKVSYYWVSFTV